MQNTTSASEFIIFGNTLRPRIELAFTRERNWKKKTPTGSSQSQHPAMRPPHYASSSSIFAVNNKPSELEPNPQSNNQPHSQLLQLYTVHRKLSFGYPGEKEPSRGEKEERNKIHLKEKKRTMDDSVDGHSENGSHLNINVCRSRCCSLSCRATRQMPACVWQRTSTTRPHPPTVAMATSHMSAPLDLIHELRAEAAHARHTQHRSGVEGGSSMKNESCFFPCVLLLLLLNFVLMTMMCQIWITPSTPHHPCKSLARSLVASHQSSILIY